ncbi:hemin ABC transporter substrate-binding protein [Allopusillimonas soli]|uniref:ABC transporter substrate-binding protein n=1 Tax=Allopusillimonas soli TaxID=659016 RepID=A0A853FMB4_9BURK|nr:ABC transporter substrate-binding protein [Allopusillimonas soli]TEA69595.1 hemin ABC transporter substrate-binding protein [Allopusillimonas soli]
MVRALGCCLGLAIAAAAMPARSGDALPSDTPQRVVTLGGSVTEIVYELGQGDRLVAVDASSLYPEEATALPQVGYYRTVPLEGVLSVKPDLVLASENAGPPEVLQRLQSLGITLSQVSDGPSLDSLYKRIDQVAGALHVPEQGQALSRQIRQAVQAASQADVPSLRAVVIVNRTGPFMAAGEGTAAGAMLALAGLTNAAAGHKGYKPLSAEGMAALQPDMIITTTTSAQGMGGLDAVRAKAGIAMTPAARSGRVIAMDDLLILGIGPRVAQAIAQLKQAAMR